MKKLLAIFLTVTLILALTACGKTETPAPEATATPGTTAEPTPEPTPAPTVEEWYGQSRGVELTLALSSDGTYTLAMGGESKSGAWTEADGGIALDGDETAPLYEVNGQLMWPGMGLYLSAEKPENGAYVPADVLTDGVTAELFNGYWQSAFVDADGVILSAFELDDKTDVYIEKASPWGEAGTAQAVTDEGSVRAALGGPLFGDVAVDMAFSDGALTWSEGGVSVRLQLQSDGLMRMTLSAPDSDMTLYLLPTYVEGLSPAPEEGADTAGD